jgi:predicted nucleic acid-binding protein
MKKLRIYLDTSVVNFLFAEDAPDFQRVTVELFDRYAGVQDLYASDVVLGEIGRAPVVAHRERLLNVLVQYGVAILPATRDDEVARLADAYVRQGAVSARQRNDALHVAYAAVFEMDALLSWNFKHLANIRREAVFTATNQLEGYWRSPRIVSPLEVEDEGVD